MLRPAAALSGCLQVGSGRGRGHRSWQRGTCGGIVEVAASQRPHGGIVRVVVAAWGMLWCWQSCGGAAVAGRDVLSV
jgi:hypothetical protein